MLYSEQYIIKISRWHGVTPIVYHRQVRQWTRKYATKQNNYLYSDTIHNVYRRTVFSD